MRKVLIIGGHVVFFKDWWDWGEPNVHSCIFMNQREGPLRKLFMFHTKTVSGAYMCDLSKILTASVKLLDCRKMLAI